MLDLSPLFERIREIEKQAPQLLRLAANVAKQDIVERTMSGADVNEQEFKGYTPRYLKKKDKAGVYTGHVDHHWTGALFDSIEYFEGADNSVSIFFSEGYEPIARGLQNRWGRDWWGVNAITEFKVMAIVTEATQKVLSGETVYA